MVGLERRTLRAAIFGTGFMGRTHLEGLRRTPFVEVAGIAGRTRASAERLAMGFGVARATDDYRELLEDASLDAVHVCTPNALHYPMAKAALLKGKHVLCEKPLATSAIQARELASLARERGLRNCVCHNLRYYPMVQQMRQMREDGELGEVLVVQGTYSQDWLLYPADWNWRIEESSAGPMRAMGDIGSHWFDMAEHVTGLRVSSLCADLKTFHPRRQQPVGSTETFVRHEVGETREIEVTTDDFGAVIFRMGERARGAMTASQVSAGRKNRLSLEVYGSMRSVAWDQERPDELWIGNRDNPNQIAAKDPTLLGGRARAFADLPGGHSEGYDDTFKQVFARFYASIANPKLAPEYPQFSDGLRQMVLLDAELESHRGRRWADVTAV